MADVKKNLVWDTTTTTGTGTLSVAGSAPIGHKTISASFTNGQTGTFKVRQQTNHAIWEIFKLGLWSTAGNTLTRGTFVESSTGAPIDFGAGTKDIIGTIDANQVATVADIVSSLTAADIETILGYAPLETVAETDLAFTDIATANASTTKHGLLKKLSNVATDYMNGLGNFVPAVTAGYVQIGSPVTVSGTPATISFTNIDNEDLLIVFDGVKGSIFDQILRMKVSIDNGSTYTTTGIDVCDQGVSTTAKYYTVAATGAKIGFLNYVGGKPSTTAIGINSAAHSNAGYMGNFNAGAKINAIQFLPSNGTWAVGTPGTVTLYGKN